MYISLTVFTLVLSLDIAEHFDSLEIPLSPRFLRSSLANWSYDKFFISMAVCSKLARRVESSL